MALLSPSVAKVTEPVRRVEKAPGLNSRAKGRAGSSKLVLPGTAAAASLKSPSPKGLSCPPPNILSPYYSA